MPNFFTSRDEFRNFRAFRTNILYDTELRRLRLYFLYKVVKIPPPNIIPKVMLKQTQLGHRPGFKIRKNDINVERVNNNAQMIAMNRQLRISSGLSHCSFGSSTFAYCRVKGLPIKIVTQIRDAKNPLEIIAICSATNTNLRRLIVIAQAIKKNKVPHCRMKPLRNSLKPNITLAKREIIIDLSRLTKVLPDKKRNRIHGIKPKRNFTSSISSSILPPYL